MLGSGHRGDRRPCISQPASDHDLARRHRGAPLRRRSSAAPVATRRRPGPRSGSSRSATTSVSGTRKRSGPSCGTSTTVAIKMGEHFRVFPISNWTELDIWQYIADDEVEIPSIYFAHKRNGLRARRDVARRERLRRAHGERGRLRGARPLPDGRRRHDHRRRRIERGHRREDHRRGGRHPPDRARGHPRRRPQSPKPRWKTARKRARWGYVFETYPEVRRS